MKFISSFIDDINIKKGKYHAFHFETSYLLKLFKQHLFAYFNSKPQLETQFLNVIDSSNKELKTKDFHFISFDCHHIDLSSEKSTTSHIQKLLFHQLENNPRLLEKFLLVQHQLNIFTNSLDLNDGELSIEFEVNEKAILNLIKSLDIVIEFKANDYIPNYKVRDFLIRALLEMNMDEKEPILIISHPETDIGRLDFSYVINTLKELGITIIVLSSQREFLTAAKDEQLFLINQYGQFYDIINLRRELKAFNIVKKENPESLARSIALIDFNEEYILLNKEIKDFLMSNKL